MNGADLQAAWATWLIDALGACGVRNAVVSPGSRSTPLVLAIAAAERRGGLTSTVVVDERSAGFFALGQARATGEPTLLVCTSGTAGAHYLPAVVEASRSRLPLIVLTADRPFELRHRGASQTIDQANMFGRFVSRSIEVGPADPDPRAVDGLLRTAVLAVHATVWPQRGPVHLNLGFRKPLEPTGAPDPALEALQARVADTLASGLPSPVPPAVRADPRALDEAAGRIRRARRGLLVLGPMNIAEAPAPEAVAAFADATGFPVLAEATSQHRFGAVEYPSACDVFEPLFSSPEFLSARAPDLVVHLGAAPVGRALGAWIATSGVDRIAICPHELTEPFNQAAQILVGDAGGTLQALADLVGIAADLSNAGVWSRTLVEAAATAAGQVGAYLDSVPADALHQGKAVQLAVQAVPQGGLLMLGNSMPVRDVDLYSRAAARGIRVLSQRGAAGIDGLISGALGAAVASRLPTVLLLGDVSFQHDVGGLALGPVAHGAEVPVAIVVLQNGGGRLFELLPVRGQPAMARTFERFFLTPPAPSAEAVAGAFGLRARLTAQPAELAEALADAMAQPGVTVIEAVVDGPAAVQAIGRIAASLERALGGRAGA
ncbi:MAG: 2-succinyl-5-enolpyruvyl-6-hydroxy-3-cyclohexene-1-carboxylic-acid synthase [Gemmatimonadota bacterium]|nr:2-succinyl-5-enolpyruvyl-6-hydroxy-3-cyclohexene-1-carboxylic-acid synthase [Gemmatimonadota bacterium]